MGCLRWSSSTDQQSSEAAERVAPLEQLVGRLTLVLDIEKSRGETPKQKHLLELTPMEQREMVESLRTDFSVQQICETLSFTPSRTRVKRDSGRRF